MAASEPGESGLELDSTVHGAEVPPSPSPGLSKLCMQCQMMIEHLQQREVSSYHPTEFRISESCVMCPIIFSRSGSRVEGISWYKRSAKDYYILLIRYQSPPSKSYVTLILTPLGNLKSYLIRDEQVADAT